MSPTETEDEIATIAKRWKNKRGSLIMALHGLQDRYGYVPREAAMSLGEQMDVPLARIYEVLTFYNYFRLKSPGKHVVSVCMGTACYLKGAPQLLSRASEELGIKPGETTADGKFFDFNGGKVYYEYKQSADKTAQHNLGVYYASLEAAEEATAHGEAPSAAASDATA